MFDTGKSEKQTPSKWQIYEMTRELAYIDEFGDTNLETTKSGVSSHFIIAAVLISENRRDGLEGNLEKIREKYFQTGEMKSVSVGKNDDRRRKILTQLASLPFKFHALIVDKRELWKDSGLTYKRSFLKYLHGLVYRKLFTAFPDLIVTADEHGSSDFMNGFIQYVDNNHKPDLFTHGEFQFSTSDKAPLLQIPDFIAGTLARIYDQTI